MNKIFVSTLSSAISERDDIIFQIEKITNGNNTTIPAKHQTAHLKNLFKKLSVIELTIETIQVYYAKKHNKPETKTETETETSKLNNKKNDNNS